MRGSLEGQGDGSLPWAPCQSAAGARLPGGRRAPGGRERGIDSGRAGGKRGLREARTHLHTPRSGRARAAGAPARTVADSCCSSGLARRRGGGEVGRPQAKKGARPGSCGLVGAELAGFPGRAAGWPAVRACRLPSPAASPSLERAAPPSWLQRLREGSELFPKWLAARPRLQLPVVQAASENAPCSL